MRQNVHQRMVARTCRHPVQHNSHSFRLFSFILFSIMLIAVSGTALSAVVAKPGSPVMEKVLLSEGLNRNRETQRKAFIRAINAYENNDYHLALRLLIPLAQNNHTEAQFYTGLIFDAALGVPHDPVMAFSWYSLSAANGYHHAQHNLAVSYARGDGTRKDIGKALLWWKRAARQGNTDSQYNLGILYATGNESIERDLQKAEQWWRKAAINGDAMAQYNLGALYASGEQKITSYCEAIRWWEESARSGLNQALHAIEILKQRADYTPCQVFP